MVRAACFIALMLCELLALVPAQAAEYPRPCKTDRLESALSPVARLVELQAEPMAKGDPSVIAPGGTCDLRLSLTGISQVLSPNKRFPVVLIFENAGVIRVDTPLLAIEATQ